MRIILTIAFLACATNAVSQYAVSQQPTSSVLDQTVRALPQHVIGLRHNALPNSDDMHHYAIANATVAGAEQSFGETAATLYDPATAEELLASYREANRAPVRIGPTDVTGALVLALDDFATGPMTYDWKRLTQEHPHVKAILRVSAPATAGVYAVVRVEVISPAGPLWGNFIELQRQPNGSWQHTRAVAGNLWK